MTNDKLLDNITDIITNKLPEVIKMIESPANFDGRYCIRSLEVTCDFIKVTFVVSCAVNNEYVWYFRFNE